MADDYAVISDHIADKLDLSAAEVTDLVHAIPFLDLIPMEESSNGATHKYSKETGAPVVGFRAENTGREMDTSEDTLVTITLKILDWTFEVDKAVADAWMKGGPTAWCAREGMRNLKAALKVFEKQIIYGDQAPGDTAGFAGIVDAATVDALADAMVINATGSTANTGSSVYGVRIGPNDITGVFKGDMLEVGDTIVSKRIVNPGTDNKIYPTYYTPACTWLGLAVGSIYSLGRIVNLTAQSGKGLTDLLMSQLLESYPTGHEPSHFVMSRRSRGQLQRSRTTYSPTGAPAPLPTEYEGIPIICTDSVVNTEAILA